jgi:hypothetical protein
VKFFRTVTCLALLVHVAAAPAASEPARCSRVVAVGDLHGGFDAFLTILGEARLVDGEGRWIGGEACLVQTGDVVDRGDRSREILDLLMRLSTEAPSRVHALLGNHEVMNLVGDLRYVSVAEFAAFSGEETREDREAGYRDFSAAHPELPDDDAARRAAFDAAYPPGWFAHRRAFSPEGRYGKWLLGRPVILKLGDSLFVHGGIEPEDPVVDPDELNRLVHRDLREFLELRAALVADGWIRPLASFPEAFAEVRGRLAAETATGDDGPAGRARRLLRLTSNRFSDESSPVWSRKLALFDEAEFAPAVAAMLAKRCVARIVVGHTTQRTGSIASRFDGTVFLIDTGAGPTYGGRPAALEIEGETVRAVYPGETRVLVAKNDLSDAEIERFLREGKVVETKEIGEGITRPLRVVLELDGKRRRAAFKTVEVHRPGLTYFEGAPPESNFTDSYRYERAAYRLDRHLGLGMVPVAVIRRLDGKEGALVDWVENAIDEEERRARNLQPLDPEGFERQRGLMHVFDALLFNVDRNLGNQLITLGDWRLHLIDHTRAFRQQTGLPPRLDAVRMRLPETVVERLRALDAEGLGALTEGLLTKSRMKALLARRDRILARLEREASGP